MNKRKIEIIIEAAEHETNFYQDWQEYPLKRSKINVEDMIVIVQEVDTFIHFYVVRSERVFKEDGDIYDLTETERVQLVFTINIDYFRSF